MSEESKKKYYSIGEAAALVGLKEHVLRQWEDEFPKTLQPQRTSSNHRRYTADDIAVLRRIKHLVYYEKMQLSGARLRLEEERYQSGSLRDLQDVSYTLDAIADAARSIINLFDPDSSHCEEIE